MLTEIKAFEDNVSIKSVLSYLDYDESDGYAHGKKDDPLIYSCYTHVVAFTGKQDASSDHGFSVRYIFRE